MNKRLEDRIRDYLAGHLDLLEPDLILIKSEYSIPNLLGAGGRIDILARDRFGSYLIIEIKRSDQAARQALNEMFKYTGLFQRNQGLDATKVRLFVVSTEWHELLLPLSEYADTVDYSLQGFIITALPDGTVTSASRVSFLPAVERVEISRIQGVYLWQTADKDNLRAIELSAKARSVGIKDFVILSCEHDRSNRAVVFGYALWLCFSSPFRTMSKPDIARLKKSLEWVDNLDVPEENFICSLNRELGAFSEDLENGYPEKLTNIERTWKISVIVREGRLASGTSILSDNEIVKLAKMIEGGSDLYFGKVCSPRLMAAWKQTLVDIRLPLEGNRHWDEILPALLERVASESPDASVSIAVYNPCNLMMSLYEIASRSDYSKCASLEICVEDSIKKQFTIFASSLAWNGNIVAASPESIAEDVYGSFMILGAGSAEREEEALSAHGLSTPIIACIFREQSRPTIFGVRLEGESIVFSQHSTASLPTLEGFEAANRAYLKALKAYLESFTIGLSGSGESYSNQTPQ